MDIVMELVRGVFIKDDIKVYACEKKTWEIR